MEKTFYEVPCTTVLQVRVKGRILEGSLVTGGNSKASGVKGEDMDAETLGW